MSSSLFGRIRLRRVVIQRHHDQTARPIERQSWIHAALIVQIIHLAGMPALQPSRNLRQFRESLRRSHAAQFKSYAACLLANPARPCGQIHGDIMPSTAVAARHRLGARFRLPDYGIDNQCKHR
jgi:hypothetical protein